MTDASNALGAIAFGFSGMVSLAVLPIAASGWWASMCTAGCLCRDLAAETVENARTTDPKNAEEWEAKVNRPALALIAKFELLSDGWSGGLVGTVGFCWLMALGYFALGVKSINELDVGMLALAAFFALLPFPLAWDIAGTSSCCDELMAELNKARIKHGEEVHLKIHCLETALKQLVRPHPSVPACPCRPLAQPNERGRAGGRTRARALASWWRAPSSTGAPSQPARSSSAPASSP